MSNETKTQTQFLDTYGKVWVVCSADHPEAEAFGPEGVARPLGVHVDPLLDQFWLEGDWWVRAVTNRPRFQRSKGFLETEERSKEFAKTCLEEADEFRARGEQKCFFENCTTTGLKAADALEARAGIMEGNARWYAELAQRWEEIEIVEQALHDATWGSHHTDPSK